MHLLQLCDLFFTWCLLLNDMQKLDGDTIPGCLCFPLANLLKVQVELWSFDESETAVLGCLLQSSPALQILEFRIIMEEEEDEDVETPKYMQEFVENLSSLKRASTQATIRRALHF